MSRALATDARCAAIAATQHGLITHQQLIEVSLSRTAIHRRVRAGALVRMLPKVFRLEAAPRTWQQRAMAIFLWAGSDSAICGLAAAALHRLDGFGLPTVIDVVAPRGTRPPNRLIVVRRPGAWSRHDRILIAGIGVTTCTRTLTDIARMVTHDVLEIAIEDAYRRRLTTAAELRRALASLPLNQPGRTKLRLILEMQDGARITDSALEVRCLQLLRRHGYPAPTRQEVLERDGTFLGRVDLIYPGRRLVIEVDGYAPHDGRRKFDSDRERGNRVTASGMAVLHFTSAMLRGPRCASFLHDLQRAYNRLFFEG